VDIRGEQFGTLFIIQAIQRPAKSNQNEVQNDEKEEHSAYTNC
jgi:hypothetical protein